MPDITGTGLRFFLEHLNLCFPNRPLALGVWWIWLVYDRYIYIYIICYRYRILWRPFKQNIWPMASKPQGLGALWSSAGGGSPLRLRRLYDIMAPTLEGQHLATQNKRHFDEHPKWYREMTCEVYTHLAHCASLLEYEMPGAAHCWAKSFTQNINFHLTKPAPQLFGSCRSCCAGMAHAILTGKIDPRGAWLAVHKRSRSQMKIMGLAELQLFPLQCTKTHPIVTAVENLHVYPQQSC